MGFGHRRMETEACGSGSSGEGDEKVEVITCPMVIEQKVKKERSREKEKERTKLRERHRRSITSNILAGLRRYGNYNLPIRADINDVIKALAREAGWTVEADGTTYRSKVRTLAFHPYAFFCTRCLLFTVCKYETMLCFLIHAICLPFGPCNYKHSSSG